MATHYKTYTFKQDEVWETIDSYWSSPLSFWAGKSLRVEPSVPLRVVVWGSAVAESDRGFINYGGMSAVLVQRVQARGRAGEKIRAEISDEVIEEPPPAE